jgi:hypothetical protein
MAALSAAPSLAQDKEIHRVVTTLDKSNKSVALFDGKVPLKIGGAGEGVASIRVTEKGPADFSWDADRSGARKGFAPSNGGTYMLVVDFPPVGPEVDKLDVNTIDECCRRRCTEARGTPEQPADAPNPYSRLCDHHGRRDRHDARHGHCPSKGRRRSSSTGD